MFSLSRQKMERGQRRLFLVSIWLCLFSLSLGCLYLALSSLSLSTLSFTLSHIQKLATGSKQNWLMDYQQESNYVQRPAGSSRLDMITGEQGSGMLGSESQQLGFQA
ncbi:unnamed protein product [Amoebophrya sp. A120]|nr:unnamed protein product [Amoebophrya sp. A120]|eukprot:GSA120T00001936001.1